MNDVFEEQAKDFITRAQERLATGLAGLAAEGVRVDEVLTKELAEPGSDERMGVNVIARPTGKALKVIEALQQSLRSSFPNQYYYPLPDLHLTVVELCHSKTIDEAERIAQVAEATIKKTVENLSSIHLRAWSMGADRGGLALNSIPVDTTLRQARSTIAQSLTAGCVPGEPRYAADSAHITFMRFLQPMEKEELTFLHKIIQTWTVESQADWEINEVALTFGANWYGMRRRVTERGPWQLKQ